MKKRRILAAIICCILLFITLLGIGSSREAFWHRGPQPGDWAIRHLLTSVLSRISPRIAYGIDLHMAKVEKVLAPHKTIAREIKIREERLAVWKESFPWKPIFDSELLEELQTYTSVNELPDKQLKTKLNLALSNHLFLKKFYQDPVRLSLPFSQFFQILSEHDRGHHPVLVARSFNAFHHFMNEVASAQRSKGTPIPKTISQRLFFPDLVWTQTVDQSYTQLNEILGHWEWFNPTIHSKAGKSETKAIIHRLYNEMENMNLVSTEALGYWSQTTDIATDIHQLNPEETGLLIPHSKWNPIAEAFLKAHSRLP